MNIYSYNKNAWDLQAKKGSFWSTPVSEKEIGSARSGHLKIMLTPTKAVPPEWLGQISGKKVLCLASAGGQQGPLLSAAGAEVTVFDASEEQLDKDELVANRDELKINLIQGDMADLSVFPDSEFDLIVHPCSNCFIPDIKPVWRESYRVLKTGGSLLSGFNNPIIYTWDTELEDQGILQVKYKLPYSDIDSLTEQERARYMEIDQPIEFGHSLEEQIGGQLKVGFVISGFYEDIWGTGCTVDQYLPQYLATWAKKA